MNEPQTYSASDIERYHRGEMTAAEMHLLEKAALDDPMLADALEGYAATKTATTDLRTLQSRLQKRINEKQQNKTLIFDRQWLKVAAVVLLLAGAGWLAIETFSGKRSDYATVSRNDSANIDKVVITEKADTTSSTVLNYSPTPSADSIKRNETVVADNTKTFKYKIKTAPVTGYNENRINNDTAVNNQLDLAANNPTQDASRISSFPQPETKRENIDSNRLANLGGRAAGVTVRTINDSTKHVDVVLKKLNTPVDEVVISKGVQKSRVRGVPVVIDSLEPEQGWTSFDDYVAQNLKAPEDIKQKSTYDKEKEVELSFDVDSYGNPVNIKVTKSLCEKCDAEAIRLLKEGPKWKGKKAKGKVKIKFPLSP